MVRIAELIAEVAELPVAEIQEYRTWESLGLDSLDLCLLSNKLDEAGISIDLQELAKIDTVGQLYLAIEALPV